MKKVICCNIVWLFLRSNFQKTNTNWGLCSSRWVILCFSTTTVLYDWLDFYTEKTMFSVIFCTSWNSKNHLKHHFWFGKNTEFSQSNQGISSSVWVILYKLIKINLVKWLHNKNPHLSSLHMLKTKHLNGIRSSADTVILFKGIISDSKYSASEWYFFLHVTKIFLNCVIFPVGYYVLCWSPCKGINHCKAW